MGTLFAGIIRAPMTSVFMIFEITQDYQIFVPLMVANMISLFISRRYQKESAYQALLKQDRVHLPGPLVQQSVGGWRAGDVMSTDVERVIVEPAMPAARAIERATAAQATTLIVGRRDHVNGLVPVDAIERAIADGRPEASVASLMIHDWTHVHPDHAIDVVLDRFGRNPGGLLPVLNRANVQAVDGVITRETLMRVFGSATARRPEPKGS
jgi:CIC family chloride channel protein